MKVFEKLKEFWKENKVYISMALGPVAGFAAGVVTNKIVQRHRDRQETKAAWNEWNHEILDNGTQISWTGYDKEAAEAQFDAEQKSLREQYAEDFGIMDEVAAKIHTDGKLWMIENGCVFMMDDADC